MIKKSTLLDLCFIGVAFIVFSNLNGIAYGLFGISAAFSSFILAFCLIIIYNLFRYKKITLPHYVLSATIILFLGLGTIGWLFFSHHHHRLAQYYPTFRNNVPPLILIYAIYKYIIYAHDRGKLINVLYFITFSLLFVTLIVPIDSVFGIIGIAFKGSGSSRGAGFFGNPNLAGVHSNLTLCFVLFFITNSKRFSLLFLALVPIVLYAGFLTFSKATIISGLAIVILFILLNTLNITRMLKARRRRFGVALLIIIAGLIYAMPSIMKYGEKLSYTQMKRIEQVGQLASGQFDSETTTHRSVLWKEAAELIAKKPITGYGIGAFHTMPKGRLGCHNMYLMLWGEGGIFVITAFLIFIVMVYYRAIFWVRDPSYRFLIVTVFFIITIQFYMSSHNGMSLSELNCMLGVIFALLETQRGRIDHLKHSKYASIDYTMKTSIYK